MYQAKGDVAFPKLPCETDLSLCLAGYLKEATPCMNKHSHSILYYFKGVFANSL